MSEELEFLIEEARRYEMSSEEKRDQIISFAYGNTHLENPAITREHVEEAMAILRMERETPICS